jgi:hypothetical protein
VHPVLRPGIFQGALSSADDDFRRTVLAHEDVPARVWEQIYKHPGLPLDEAERARQIPGFRRQSDPVLAVALDVVPGDTAPAHRFGKLREESRCVGHLLYKSKARAQNKDLYLSMT